MKALVTGSNGTLGRVLCDRIKASGDSAIGWDRNIAPAGDEEAAKQLFEDVKPDVVIHTALPSKPTGTQNEGWLVNEKWTSDIARFAGEASVPFVYTSTVMVYTNKAQGPFLPETQPDETEGYGHSKMLGERAALDVNSDAKIARLGWQIGSEVGTNNMFHYLQKQQDETNEVTASSKWLPATSFLEDTADALLRIAQMDSGIYHIDGNKGWNFYEIVCALNKLHGNIWNVRETGDFTQDQRMSDHRVNTAQLSDRLVLPKLS